MRLLRTIASAVVLTCILSAPARAQGLLALVDRANAEERAGRHADAVVAWRGVYAIAEGDPAPLYLVARSAVRAGQHAAAIAALRQALDDGLVPRRPLASDTTLAPLLAHADWPALVRRAATLEAARDTALRQELLALAAREQEGRTHIDSILRTHGMPSPQADSAIARMEAIDAPVQARLRAIVAARGWPGRRLVGDDAAHAAWLVTQHMDAAHQRALLPALQAAVARGDARAADAALLEDRVRTNTGAPQRYGSQLRPPKPGAAPELFPIDRPECVDQRRAAVKLAPLASYLTHFGVTWSPPAGARCAE